jgi:hypothetical protein
MRRKYHSWRGRLTLSIKVVIVRCAIFFIGSLKFCWMLRNFPQSCGITAILFQYNWVSNSFFCFFGFISPPEQHRLNRYSKNIPRVSPKNLRCLISCVTPRCIVTKTIPRMTLSVLFKLCFLFYLTISRVRLVFSSLSLSTLHVNYIIAVRVNTSCKLHYCGSSTLSPPILTMESI